MRSSFFLSALRLATVHSCSRSVSVDNTSASSVGGGVVSSSLELLAFDSPELEFARFRFSFELSGRSTFAFRFAFLLDALIIRGNKNAAAIPSPTSTMNNSAKIPRTHGHAWRLPSPEEPRGVYEPGG